jgi:hypothetical protein
MFLSSIEFSVPRHSFNYSLPLIHCAAPSIWIGVQIKEPSVWRFDMFAPQYCRILG